MSGNKPEHLRKLEAEEKELEEMVYGKREESNEEIQATSGEEVPEESETVQTEEEVVEEEVQATEETAEVVEAQDMDSEDDEDDDSPEDEKKPKRVPWKKKFLELEKRYKGLRNAHDNDKFQFRKQFTEQSNLIDALNEKIDVLSKRLAETSADNKVDVKSLFSEDDVDILGESAIDSLTRVAEKLVDARVSPIQQELEDRKKSDAQRRKELAEFHQREQAKAFADRLANLVPNYTDIDTDPGFLEYLGEDDPVNGNTRFHWFKDAQANGNVGTVANYFKEYEEMTKQPERILENKITPTGNQGSSGPPPKRADSKGEVYPYSIWEKFHNDVVSGNFKGTNADRVALDKEFDRAYNEGRIDYSR